MLQFRCQLVTRLQLTIFLILIIYSKELKMAGNVILDFPHTQPQLKPEIELKFMDLPENGSVSSLKTYQLLLKRDKRYLLWAGGGISKVKRGYSIIQINHTFNLFSFEIKMKVGAGIWIPS